MGAPDAEGAAPRIGSGITIGQSHGLP